MTTNYERAFAAHADVYEAWVQLNAAIKAGLDLRRYELATLAAALALRSSYCSLAHGLVLAEQFGEEVVAIVRDRTTAGLDDADVAVMDLAERVVLDPGSITATDRDRVVALGVPDRDVELVMLAAAARCFFSKALDALGAAPDATYHDLEPGLRSALTVGRPIEPR